MKYSNKFMLVPFVNKQQQHSPEEKYLNNLDTEMSNILNNKKLSTSDKLKQYNHTLNLYINKNQDANIKVESNQNQIVENIIEKLNLNKIKEESIEPLEQSIVTKEQKYQNKRLKQKRKNILNESSDELQKVLEKKLLKPKHQTEPDLNQTVIDSPSNKKNLNNLQKQHNKSKKRELRNNTNPADFDWKIKNSLIGNGINIKNKWLTKSFF
jgi:hypothetical protein